MSSTEASSIPFQMVKTITDDFSKVKKIGSGGYGEVYRGSLNGDEVAVKKLFPVNDIVDVDFNNEFSNLMKVQHKNIVRLLHYCYEKVHKHTQQNGQFFFSEVTDRALCFEYMKLGSLSKHITDESCEYDWPTTYKIIKGTCEGLHHLHKGRGEKNYIYHLDLKPDNILLDENLVPKIGDFGLSRLFGDSKTHETSKTKGTIGFMPPEYINNAKVTPKNDVFSLGVIIFYILAGKKGYDDYSDALRRQNYSPNIRQGFIKGVEEYWKKKMEATVGYRWDETDILGITKCAEIAISCVHAERDSRPSTMAIIGDLNKLDARIEEILKNDPKPLIGVVPYEKLALLESSPIVMEAIKEKMSLRDSGKGNRTMEQQNVLERILEGSMKPTHLPLETLRNITEDFSVDRIIGEGGFGKVYKGVVGNKNVAVKRIRSSMTINQKLFRREVDSQMDVNHENIVRFLGLCSHTVETPMENPEAQGRYIYAEIRERLLCFEFVSNGSLDKYITDELRGLEWGTRYRIIKGICAGLHYLHTEKHILHMDLKPANILLDNQMVPKITDFGLSRPMEISQTMTTHYFSSPGYGAPENLFGRGSMSVKSDMYSLGAIIIEMVTGQKGIPANNNSVLRRWRHSWNKSAKETPLEYYHQVTECIEIAKLCLNLDPHTRPSISQVMDKFVEMESTKINPIHWEDDMLGVEPLELQFGFNKEQILSCSVELSNDTDCYIAFKIETTSPLPYSIEPNKDIVKPRSKFSVDIKLPFASIQDYKAELQYNSSNERYSKELIVQSFKVNEGLTTKDINKNMFGKYTDSHHVDEIHLVVVSGESCSEEVIDSRSNKQAGQ